MPRRTPTYRKLDGRHHPLVKRIRRMLRSGELLDARSGERSDGGMVLLETARMVEDALAGGVPISALLLRRNVPSRFARSARFARFARFNDLLEKLPAETAVYEVAPAVFETLVTTETSQGILALAEQPHWRDEDLFPARSPALILVLAGLQDPGNLGAILRAAEAFGATGVLLAPGTVSPYNPKALRATAGAIFRLPILRGLSAAEIAALLRKHRVKLFTTVVAGGLPPVRVSFTSPLAVVFGSEAAGVPPEFRNAGELLTIPLAAHVESLNVAAAASVLLYEIARQRGR